MNEILETKIKATRLKPNVYEPDAPAEWLLEYTIEPVERSVKKKFLKLWFWGGK